MRVYAALLLLSFIFLTRCEDDGSCVKHPSGCWSMWCEHESKKDFSNEFEDFMDKLEKCTLESEDEEKKEQFWVLSEHVYEKSIEKIKKAQCGGYTKEEFKDKMKIIRNEMIEEVEKLGDFGVSCPKKGDD